MYIILDKKEKIFQIGFSKLTDLLIQRGIFINNNEKNNDYNLYIFERNFNFFLDEKNSVVDYRVKINQKSIFFIILYFLIFIEKISFYMNSNFNRRVFSIFAIFLFIFLSSINNILLNKNHKNNLIKNQDVHYFLDKLRKSEFAKKISYEKKFYYFGEVPKIKESNEYRIFPLNYMDSGKEVYNGYLVVPYKQIILIDNEEKSYLINPKESCLDMNKNSVYFYKITNKNLAALFENKYINENKFNIFIYIFPENYFSNIGFCNFISSIKIIKGK